MGFENNVPIYIQLVERIRFLIVSGSLRPGERLLSVREWALQEKVNPNTMHRALAELEASGLILTERTNGKYVTSDLELIRECRKKEAAQIVQEFYGKMSHIGISPEEALLYLRDLKGE